MAALQDHRFFPKPLVPLCFPASHLRSSVPLCISIHKAKSLAQIPPPDAANPLRNLFSARKIPTFSGNPEEQTLRILVSSEKASPLSRSLRSIIRFRKTAHRPVSLFDLLSSIDLQVSTQKIASCSRIPSFRHSFALLLSAFSSPFPANAADSEQVSQKINIEHILVSIDDFFNRNPFFVAGVTVIWLVLIPLTQEYLKKYKFISAIDAFRKLRDMPNAQLLDVRKRQSVKFMDSPNLRILNKNVVQVEYSDGNEEGFIKEVLRNFEDPGNTVICVLDNFDGDSLKLAELLYKNGFKEAYAIKGGLRGKDGWQEIQETFLPPSVHVHPRKKNMESAETEANNQMMNDQIVASSSNHHDKNLNTDNGFVEPTETISTAKLIPERPLSPYPNYPELKPPSSPSPSKPQS
ncbi:unnamed protein product [Musa acuminata subsp. malaccensis]|uniref:(wild Malaysian banana) hypothetical protein n=1 Tax=Musa acuminata subsp. malaccensis TaxID=214687 RepID=A0A804L5P8_MUSAM|nr:PREDICTED: rhodanese-like domain-containing protein 4, chloroplastic [Musa acuminata subsp. malaccensis]CAG1863937.1 unnamed protein product [Musa acuminata subsp. malaccensis]